MEPTTTLWKMESDGMTDGVLVPSPTVISGSISIPSTPTAAPPSYEPTTSPNDDTDDSDDTDLESASALTPAEIAEGDPLTGVAAGQGSSMPVFDDDALIPQSIAANDPNDGLDETVEEEMEEDVEDADAVSEEDEEETTESDSENNGGWASVTHEVTTCATWRDPGPYMIHAPVFRSLWSKVLTQLPNPKKTR